MTEKTQSNLSWLSNSSKKEGGGIFDPPSFFVFIFFFFPALFSLSPLLLFTHFIHLHFLPLHTISSLENHFPKPLTCFRSSPSKSFQIFVFLTIFATNPFFETHLQTFIFIFYFFALSMASSNGPSFLTFNGKKISPIPWMEWGRRAPPRPQDPCSTLQKKTSRWAHFLVSLLANLLVSCFVGGLMLRHCHFVVVCSCWNYGHCMIWFEILVLML